VVFQYLIIITTYICFCHTTKQKQTKKNLLLYGTEEYFWDLKIIINGIEEILGGARRKPLKT